MLFRYGEVVLIGLKPAEETAFLAALKPRISGELTQYEEELAEVQAWRDYRRGRQATAKIWMDTAGADHLKALALVSRLLRDRTVCEKLRGTDNADALYALLTDHTATHAA